MPKLKDALTAEDRFNTMLSVVAVLQREESVHIDDLAKRFKTSRKSMRDMLATINMASFLDAGNFEELPYYIDVFQVDEDGIVELEVKNDVQGVPRISGTQAVSLLSGLRYLQGLPEFRKSKDIEFLISLLSVDQEAPDVSYDQNEVDSDFAALQKAILTDRRISCRYVNSKGKESVREIDPLLLVSENDIWYLKGFCLVHNEVRNFRLDHMDESKVLTVRRSSEAIAAAAQLDETAPIYDAKATDTEVVLELDPEAYKLAATVLEFKELKRGKGESVRVSIKFGYLPDLGPLVCRFGASARVISPPEAREVVRKYAETALKGYKVKTE